VGFTDAAAVAVNSIQERTMKLNRILCPIDFSGPSRIALKHAADLAAISGGEVIVLHIVEPVVYPVEYGMAPVPSMDLETTATSNARDRIAELTAEVFDRAARVRSQVVLGRADQTICDEAEATEADLIVLATHGLTGLKHLLLGSVAERVVRLAPCPVLTVKAGSEADSTS